MKYLRLFPLLFIIACTESPHKAEMEHQTPYPSGIDSQTITEAGLRLNQTITWGDESVQLFSRIA